MRIRLIGAALGVAMLAAAPVAAHAAPAKAQTSQPYTHLVQGKDWNTGGTYIATGGDIKLNLSTLEKNTQVLVEECEGPDLGDVKKFTKKAPSHTLATGIAKGTCFLVLLSPATGTGGYLVKGTLSY
ncbi:hypothetical protein HPO96_31170 [Kribbella sandramycini]|uniref:Secreted protein n=1 Tax=Kribbella sandramycini TaxID=60450 RepID=A0A7Y4P435_9ACTN|nr:hypothetical protein [Kribbella sandramycini]MBB6566998.1 hypothetical protein [Kribbella sandramycini]NOL44720.1 hypothetical protein [Kribbella sandramycini]